MPDNYIELGSLAVISLFTVKEFFAYLKTRKDNGDNKTSLEGILAELRLMNTNHLNTLQKTIDQGTKETINAFLNHANMEHQDSIRLLEILSEINGKIK